MNERRNRILIRAVILLVFCIAVFAAALHLSDRSLSSHYHEEREEGTQAFMDEGIVEWEGNRYRKKTAATTILLAGIDQEETVSPLSTSDYRSGGQADFLLLLVIDHAERKIHKLQIDRDTITEVTVLGVYGNETGTRPLQICLAHSFGAFPEDHAKYTVRAVEGLLGGLMETDGYYMVDYSAVPILNDTLGGVPVTVPEDMTSVNPEWISGHVITLHGAEAETFIRARKTIGSGTNRERMNRQGVYIDSSVSQMRRKLAENTDFGTELLSALKKIANTNLTDQMLLEEMNRSKSYEILQTDYLPGEYRTDENGFAEFYPEENAATEWVLNHLYTLR